jgi:hypothetical protein
MCLASDELSYNEEVVFSPYLIANSDGNRLPVSMNLNNSNSTPFNTLLYKNYNTGNTVISLNYYNKNNDNLSCYTAQTLCDIGLTGIDNGLVTQMTGKTISFTMGLLDDNSKFDRLSFDRRLKLFQITGYTQSPNLRFSGIPNNTLYEMESIDLPIVGRYAQLYGGFYQGFFKLQGYDYEVLPNRMNKGWSAEMLLRARQVDRYIPESGETTLNLIYPNNENAFFYFGTRAENKFYHHADGVPLSDSGYTRVTSGLVDLKTCKCSNTGVTNSNCTSVYEPEILTSQHVIGCNCGCGAQSNEVLNSDKDPKFDVLSNSLMIKLSGDPANPIVCVRTITFTGGCVTANCSTTAITYTTGYTINNYCSDKAIFDYCAGVNPDFLNKEHWFLIDVVWERYGYLDICDLYYRGGLSDITTTTFIESLSNNTVNLIQPPYTNGEQVRAETDLIQLNEKWLIDGKYRLGRLKVFVNGRLNLTIENFEEIIPRGLNTEKERQIGVPFNISWGGGTQGLHENLTFTGTPLTLTGLTYQQDPENLPNNILSGTSLSGLSTNILLEQNFGGSFDGAISQFRMYTEPLTYPEIIHNFSILKSTFNLFDYRCPDCSDSLVNDIIYVKSEIQITFNSYNFSTYSYTLYYLPENGTERIEIDSLPSGSFPISFNLTNFPFPPFDGFGTYYFYFNEIDQTISVNVSSLDSVLLVSPGIFLYVGGGENYLVV